MQNWLLFMLPPVSLDREATVGKACGLIEETGRNGADFVVFSEGYIPVFPHWHEFFLARDPRITKLCRRLFLNALEMQCSAARVLGRLARRAWARADDHERLDIFQVFLNRRRLKALYEIRETGHASLPAREGIGETDAEESWSSEKEEEAFWEKPSLKRYWRRRRIGKRSLPARLWKPGST